MAREEENKDMIERGVIEAESERSEMAVRQAASPRSARLGQRRMALMLLVILLICFGKPLYDLARFSIHGDLYSHIVLIPFITVYLIWLKRQKLAQLPAVASPWAIIPLAAGAAVLGGYWLARYSGWKPGTAEYLAMMTLSFLLFLLSGCVGLLGAKGLRAIAFPLAFLVFMVPFPHAVERWVESFLQHGSAEAAYGLFNLTGMPVFRNETGFQLPGFAMEIAPQCSGIHSSLVLFITSLLAGYLLLQFRWTKAVLLLLIVPLGILRNAFRICLLGHLCVRVNPDWINSDLHRRGGPLFFVASLVPFFLLLLVLRKLERRRNDE